MQITKFVTKVAFAELGLLERLLPAAPEARRERGDRLIGEKVAHPLRKRVSDDRRGSCQ